MASVASFSAATQQRDPQTQTLKEVVGSLEMPSQTTIRTQKRLLLLSGVEKEEERVSRESTSPPLLLG